MSLPVILSALRISRKPIVKRAIGAIEEPNNTSTNSVLGPSGTATERNRNAGSSVAAPRTMAKTPKSTTKALVTH
jgi:hypothetical protein